jgi:hypothetical protein
LIMKILLTYFSYLNAGLWTKIERSTSTSIESLSVFRIVAGIFLLVMLMPNFAWVSEVPQAFFNPPVFSIVNITSGFPPKWVFITFDVLLIVFALLITLGVKSRFSTAAFLVIYIIGSNYKFSFGKIDHSFVLCMGVLFCCAFSNWGHKLALVPDKVRNGKMNKLTLPLLAILICFGFFTAGFEKAIAWINFDLNTNGSGSWYYTQAKTSFLLTPFVPRILPFVGFKVMDFIAVIFELIPLFLLLHSKRAWLLWLSAACLFHVLNILIFNISFLSFIIVYIAFIDYSTAYNAIVEALSNLVVRITGGLLLLVVVSTRLFDLFKNDVAQNLLVAKIADKDSAVELNLYFSAIVLLIAAFILIKNAFSKCLVTG